jgi:putative lipoprotein
MTRVLWLLISGVVLRATPAFADDTRDPWFGRDKALHFSVSAGLAAGGYAAAALVSREEPPRLLFGAGFALGVGIGKEIADRYTGGDPSYRDLAWDAAGTAAGVLLTWAIDRALSE